MPAQTLPSSCRGPGRVGRLGPWVGPRPARPDDEVLTQFLTSSIWPFPRFEDKPLSASRLRPISQDQATLRLGRCLHRGLAYYAECMDEETASRLASMFVGLLSPAARWWTNGFIQADREFLESAGRPRDGSWNPLTAALFDSGVIGLDSTSLPIAWVADED